ncbi:hypothetical protein CFAM422_008902 [Trichoderma lentiforme]|uniref:Uncharacterized protein n=1 Tax=Trichoderma lentiforme TaxID=1567552 RepID=A0A9P5CBS8_9HYPO|nr:hypothetical protein CFAM422_008902 [Trichoderma lentiforme]
MSDYQQCNIHKHWLVNTALFGTKFRVAGQEGAPHSPTPASALNSLRGGWEISMIALKNWIHDVSCRNAVKKR